MPLPLIDGGTYDLSVRPGTPTFVLGANGAGKSSLMQKLKQLRPAESEWVAAHRQNWLPSNALDLTPSTAKTYADAIKHNEQHDPKERWSSQQPQQKTALIVQRAMEADMRRSSQIARNVDANQTDPLLGVARAESVFKTLSDLLQGANLPFEVRSEPEGLSIHHLVRGETYPFVQLSDGERSAVLMGLVVLTATPDTLLLIDEPERHLHRAIIAPLLSGLFRQRPDCAFVVSTHDVSLPMDFPEATVLLVRRVAFGPASPGQDVARPQAWQLDVLGAGQLPDEALRRDVLGARRKLLYVEGMQGSRDLPLYSLLFPGVSVLPRGDCREVEVAVRTLRAEHDLHWVEAFGLIDADDRTAEECQQLEAEHIYALPVRTVESVYYHPEVVALMATRAAKGWSERTAEQLTSAATDALLKAVRDKKDTLALHLATAKARLSVRHPTHKDVKAAAADTPWAVTVDLHDLLEKERQALEQLLNDSKATEISARYPIRRAGALEPMAQALGFKDAAAYEAAVRKAIQHDAAVRDQIYALFSSLRQALGIQGPSEASAAPQA